MENEERKPAQKVPKKAGENKTVDPKEMRTSGETMVTMETPMAAKETEKTGSQAKEEEIEKRDVETSKAEVSMETKHDVVVETNVATEPRVEIVMETKGETKIEESSKEEPKPKKNKKKEEKIEEQISGKTDIISTPDSRQKEKEISYDPLTKGHLCTKYGRRGNPHKRLVTLSQDLRKISWKVRKNVNFV